MAIFDNFPYSDYQQLNLDWLLKTMKSLEDSWAAFQGNVSATAVSGTPADVEVTGDLKNGLTFKFTLPQGDQGPQGPAGNGIATCTFNPDYTLTITYTDGTTYTTPSLRGPEGEGLEIKDYYATYADLIAAHPTGSPGDGYMIGTSTPYNLYIWSQSSNSWVDVGPLGSAAPSTITPLMDGTASAGLSNDYSRGDHRHPSDTSKQDVLTAGNGISIDQDNTIASTFGAAVTLPLMDAANASLGSLDTKFARADHRHPSDTSKQNVLTAGNNINIEGDTISATDTQYTAGDGIGISADYTITNRFGNLAGPDMDDMLSFFIGYAYNILNAPVTQNNGFVMVVPQQSAGVRCLQVYVPYTTSTLYIRRRVNSAWQGWTKIESIAI